MGSTNSDITNYKGWSLCKLIFRISKQHTHTHTLVQQVERRILEKSCLREKQHNAQGCYHGDTLFVEDIKCGCLHCLWAGTTPGNTGHVLTCTKHTHFNRATHSLSPTHTHSKTSLHSQKHTTNFIRRHTDSDAHTENERRVHTLCVQHLGDVKISLCHFESVVQIGHWVVLLTQNEHPSLPWMSIYYLIWMDSMQIVSSEVVYHPGIFFILFLTYCDLGRTIFVTYHLEWIV